MTKSVDGFLRPVIDKIDGLHDISDISADATQMLPSPNDGIF